MPVKTTYSLFIFLALAGILRAQSSPPVRELTLEDAIHMSLDKNYDARNASLGLAKADIQHGAASDALLPSFSASGRYGYVKSISKSSFVLIRDSDSSSHLAPGVPPGSHSVSYDIGGQINLYGGGGDAARIKSSGYNLDAAKYNLKWQRQSVAYNVTRAYVNALRTRELLKAVDKTLVQSRAQLDRIKGLYDAGAKAVGDVYQQEAAVGQQELQSITAKNDYENAKADLLYLLNLPAETYSRFDVGTTGIDTAISSLKSKTLQEQPREAEITNIINTREDFAATRSGILSSETAIGITRSNLLPSLDGNFGFQGNINPLATHTDLTNVQLAHGYYAGLNLSIPIYDRNQFRSQIETQEIDVQTSKIRLEQQEQQFRSDVAKSYNTLVNSERALESTERTIRAAEESLRSAEERFKAGAGIQTDVIVAQATIQSARSNYVNAIYSYILSQKTLEYLLGRWNY